jgi:hypothetical protein
MNNYKPWKDYGGIRRPSMAHQNVPIKDRLIPMKNMPDWILIEMGIQ